MLQEQHAQDALQVIAKQSRLERIFTLRYYDY